MCRLVNCYHRIPQPNWQEESEEVCQIDVGQQAAKHAERMEAGGEIIDTETATMYRALSDRLLCLTLDRPGLVFPAKELCRHFAHPTRAGVEALKRVVRFLVGLPWLVCHFPFQMRIDVMKVYFDTYVGGGATHPTLHLGWNRACGWPLDQSLAAYPNRHCADSKRGRAQQHLSRRLNCAGSPIPRIGSWHLFEY